MTAQYASGYVEGGAARNIECGFYPDFVQVINMTDLDNSWQANLTPIIHFDDGGTANLPAIEPGDHIRAADQGWSATVRDVYIHTGSWSGNSAEGWLFLDPGSVENPGNVADNDVIHVAKQKGGPYTATNAMVDDTDGLLEPGYNIQATPAGTDGFILYTSDTNSRGFTVPSLGADNELLYWQAFGPGTG